MWAVNPKPAPDLTCLKLELSIVDPQSLSIELSQPEKDEQGANTAEKATLAEIPDGWFAMHKLPHAPGKLGAAARCRPMAKLPLDGLFAVRVDDMRGLEVRR